jgi:hypothetical protein
MSVIGALGMVAGGAGNAALGAYQSLDFGKKGAAIGALVGVGGYMGGQALKGEDESLAGAMMAGAFTGTVQSAFSTAQELYAFHNPQHISAMSSMNTTTTATAKTNAMHHFLTSKSDKGFFDFKGRAAGAAMHLIDPSNFMTDVTRYGMITGDLSKAQGQIIDSLGFEVDESGGMKMDAEGNPMKKGGNRGGGILKGGYNILKNNVQDTLKAAESASPWFSKEATSIDINPMGTDGKRITDADGNAVTRTINLKGTESMGERAAMFVNANKEMYDGIFEGFQHGAKTDEMKHIQGLDRFKNADEYGDYLKNMEGGAVGTYKELKRAGIYGDDAPMLKKGLGIANEAFAGSPLWARTVEKQIENGTASVENIDGKMKFKGGGKAGRVMSLIGDTVGLGGGLGAAVGAAGWLMTRPFSGGQNQVNSNAPYNPV